MPAILLCTVLALAVNAEPLAPGNHNRTLEVDGRQRSYLVHVPEKYDPKNQTPLVMALHGAWTNGPVTAIYSGLNNTADDKNFIVVYPNGTGVRDAALFWNCGGRERTAAVGRGPADDVKFIGQMLDDLETVLNVDPKRIYATGISNGGMMSYRLAAEMSDRIAAIAPISGTLCLDNVELKRPVPVLHFHGTDDKLVPYEGGKSAAQELLHYKSVDDTIRTWAKLDACPEKPRVETLPSKIEDGTSVKRFAYGPGKDGSEVILLRIEGGGHTWPDRPMLPSLETTLGKTTHQISANDLMWEFFQKHPLR